MFTRSNWGLTNRARFMGARYTVYVEGGGGNPGQGSDDVLFWRAVFARLRPDLSITLKPFGGKPQLEAIAQKIAAGVVENTIVAMDADFDELLAAKITSPRVLYSYGYSWENDALVFASIETVLERLIKADNIPDPVSTAVASAYRECLNKLLRYINVDFYLRHFKSSLFPRVSNGNFIKPSPQSGEPWIDLSPLRKCCLGTIAAIPRDRSTPRPMTTIIDPQAYLQGHTLMFLVRKLLAYGVKLCGRNINLTEDLLIQMVIPAFSDHGLKNERFLYAHYTKMLSAL